MAEILPAMLDRIEKRRRMWDTIEGEFLPDPKMLNETCIVGSFSLCAMQSRRRYLIAAACIPTPLGKETPSSLARDYLTVTYRRSPPITHKQVEYLRSVVAPLPLFAIPTTFQAGYYLDIVSTYWTLLNLYGWNVDYWPGKWLAAGRAPLDWPWPDHKLARNCLVSAGMSSRVQVYKPGVGYLSVKTGNHLINLQLYSLISDTLNCVAAEMVKDAGAVYVNTDGYILPDHASLVKAIDILSSWRLPPHVKASGAGFVRGTASYHFGDGQPKRRLLHENHIAKITPRQWSNWLRVRENKIDDRRKDEK